MQSGITQEMTVLDIVAMYRETEAVFKCYDAAAGECICCNSLFETVKEVSERYGISLQKILRDLNSAISGPGEDDACPDPDNPEEKHP